MSKEVITKPTTVPFSAGPLKKLGYIFALSRYIAKVEGISLLVQYSEILVLFITRQLGPRLYFEANLWDRKYAFKDKMRFLNSSQYKKRINELNSPIYRKFTNDKLAEKSILTLLGIPTAPFIGYLHRFNGSCKNNRVLCTAKDLTSLLQNFSGQKVCFKLIEGWGGTGFVAVAVKEVNGEVFLSLLPDEKALISISDFYNEYLATNLNSGFVIESYLEQHPVLTGLNESSVNTVRMWVIQKENKIKFLGAVLRIGRQGEVIDNSMRGGIIALIDAESGQITKGRDTAIIPEYFDLHPDNGNQITAVNLPFWDESIALAKNCLRVFPHTNFVGLDMAFTVDGPVIIELNQEPDKISARIFEQPLADLLNNDNLN